MARKIISALLLAAVALWAEMTVAPLLSVHAHAAMTHTDRTDHQPAMPAHACCPKKHGAAAAPVPADEISLAGSPCADEHRCCFRQGPQSAPAPASGINRLTKQTTAVGLALVNPTACSQDFVDFAANAGFLSPPNDLSMVLRI